MGGPRAVGAMARSGNRHRMGPTATVVALLVLALVGAACGGSTTADEATPDTIASTGSEGGSGETVDDRAEEGGTDPEGPTSSVEAQDGEEDGDAKAPDASGDTNADAGDTDESDRDDVVEDGEPDVAEEPELTGPVLNQVGPDDSGDDVMALQERLAELGFDPGPADGDYGRRTVNAVLVFQELNQLSPTGRADRRTVEALSTFRYDGLVLAAGDEGDEVEELQRRLASGPFDPGTTDGVYGPATVAAVWALEKLAGVPVDGDWGPADELAWQRLMDGRVGQPERSHDQRWVEVDLSEQLMKVYDPGQTTPTLISHASSGSGIPWENEDHSGSSVTPLGDFHINRRISGWRESSLNIGRLYNPLYFNGGIAFHGATSVPLYPASHGCIRLPMHVADYLPGELPNGTPVHILA